MFPYIPVTETFVIPTYILVLSMTYSLGLIWVDRRAQTRGVSRGRALDLSLAIMVGGFVGARLFHVFYEHPERYLEDPLLIFKFWYGGFVFYGGFIGALVAAAVFLRWKKDNFLPWADFFAPIGAFGYALGRVGCFLNGCCYGKFCDLPWAVEFTHPGVVTGVRHPTQIYASLTEFAVLGWLLWLERRPEPRPAGHLFFTWLSLHALGRTFMEIFRDDYRGPQFGLSISLWLSLLLLVVALAGHFLIRRLSQPR